jgi:hypothetical protein
MDVVMSAETETALILHRRLVHCSVATLKKSLKLGDYEDVLPKGFDVSKVQWEFIEHCSTCMRCKDGRPRSSERIKDYALRKQSIQYDDEEESPTDSVSLDQPFKVQLAFDLVYISGFLCVCMVVRPSNYLLMEWIESKDAETLLEVVARMIHRVKAFPGVAKVISLSVDRETAINEPWEREMCLSEGIPMIRPAPYKHERRIERQVRSLENRYRSVLDDLGEPAVPEIKRLAFEHVVKASNFIRNSQSGDFLPIQLMRMRRSYRTPPQFGAFAYFPVDVPQSKEQERNEIGMIVGFEEQTSNVIVKFTAESKALIRKEFSVLKVQDEGREIFRSRSKNDEQIFAESDQDASVELMPEFEHERMFRVPTAKAAVEQLLVDIEESARPSEMQHVRSLLTPLSLICGLKEEASVRGEQGQIAAIKLELTKVWLEYGAIEPVKREDVQGGEVIKGKLFVTEKLDAEHEFVRNKGRFVARGDLRKDKPENVFSPTAAFATILIVLCLCLALGYAFFVMDFESAYLNADLKKGVFMKIDPKIAKIMVEMDPSVKGFLNPDGSLYVRIVKALYGLQESAKLWYELLSLKLLGMGFVRSNYDHSLYYKKVVGKDGKVVIVLIYVDDLILAGPIDVIAEIKRQLEAEFVLSCSEINPKEFDYIGIRVEYNQEEKTMLLSQPGMIEKVTKGVEKTSDVPCDVNLYKETSQEKVEDARSFRSKLMEMAWLSKTRPDIKVALGFLSTRMQDPNVGDERKLLRVAEYLNGTKHLKMRLTAAEAIQIYASADASFGPYGDGKSNTGMAITIGLGNAPVLVKSTKQKSVANSSTAAELIAFSSTLEEVLWVKELLTELGFKQEPIVIEQDNTSTMRLIERGPSSAGRTKWINVKQFWVSEHLQNGEVKPKYVPSLELLADGLTKPLGRKAFEKWRARVLNQKQ